MEYTTAGKTLRYTYLTVPKAKRWKGGHKNLNKVLIFLQAISSFK